MIHHDGKTLYENLPNPFEATRYHSLIVKRETLPAGLEVSAWTDEGEIMGTPAPWQTGAAAMDRDEATSPSTAITWSWFTSFCAASTARLGS